MLTRVILALALVPAAVGAQASPNAAPDECFGFKFGAWQPSLSSTSSAYAPGYDPTSSAPAGAPRAWAVRWPSGAPGETSADSLLLLFPPWWPAGVSIQWTQQRGDTLIGLARALVADGRLKNPESTVRATRIPCRKPEDRTSPRDTIPARGS